MMPCSKTKHVHTLAGFFNGLSLIDLSHGVLVLAGKSTGVTAVKKTLNMASFHLGVAGFNNSEQLAENRDPGTRTPLYHTGMICVIG